MNHVLQSIIMYCMIHGELNIFLVNLIIHHAMIRLYKIVEIHHTECAL